MNDPFVKERRDAPRGFFAVEAAGLRWLGEATAAGGVPVAQPLHDVDDAAHRIELPRLTPAPPSAAAAAAFGAALARTHAAGAPWFGCPPDGWEDDGFIGDLPLPHNRSRPDLSWGEFFADLRILPFAEAARRRGSLTPAGLDAVRRVCNRLTAGDETLCGPTEPVARLHGDLWSGNVVWTPRGAVLIDPAAHGGHRESDLAMLALFGLPHLGAVLVGYQSVSPLANGWQERVELHQLFPLLVHAVLFGGGYGAQAEGAALRYL